MSRADLVPCAFGFEQCIGQAIASVQRYGRPCCSGCAEELTRLENAARSAAAAVHGDVARCGLHLAGEQAACDLCAYERQRRGEATEPDLALEMAQREAAAPFTGAWRASWWKQAH